MSDEQVLKSREHSAILLMDRDSLLRLLRQLERREERLLERSQAEIEESRRELGRIRALMRRVAA